MQLGCFILVHNIVIYQLNKKRFWLPLQRFFLSSSAECIDQSQTANTESNPFVKAGSQKSAFYKIIQGKTKSYKLSAKVNYTFNTVFENRGRSSRKMKLWAAALVVSSVIATSLSAESDVLDLGDADFNTRLAESSTVLVMFYAP